MIQLEINKCGYKAVMNLGSVKYLCGDDVSKRNQIQNDIRQYFLGLQSSEYAIEMLSTPLIKINGKDMDLKRWRLLEIHVHQDLIGESKLTSKSIFSQFFESVLFEIEREPIVGTLDLLLQELCEVIQDRMSLECERVEIYPKFPNVTPKLIQKIMEIEFVKEEMASSIYDMDMEEIVLVEISMIERISKENPLKEYLVLVDLPYFTTRIYQKISGSIPPNLRFIVNLYSRLVDMNPRHVIHFGKKTIDFSDEIAVINDLIMELPFVVELSELYDLLNDYLNGVISDRVDNLRKIL